MRPYASLQFVAVSLIVVLVHCAEAQPRYRLTELKLGPGLGSTAGAINEAGQVATGGFALDGTYHALFWNGDSLVDLGNFGADEAFASSVNSAGHVVGYSFSYQTGVQSSFFWNGSDPPIGLGTLGGASTFAFKVNEADQVIGGSHTTTGHQQAFVWEAGQMTGLGTLGGFFSFASDINEAGSVVGFAHLAGNAVYHAFIWDGVQMRDLGTLGGSTSNAVAITDAGLVVGQSSTSGDARYSVFIWNGSTMQDIGSLGGKFTYAYDVNSAGHVAGAGTVDDAGAELHGFLFDGVTKHLIGSFGGPRTVPQAINDAGHMVGYGELPSGESRAILWDGTTLIDLNDLIDPNDPLSGHVVLTIGQDINNSGQISAIGCNDQTGACHGYVLNEAALSGGETPAGSSVTISPPVTLPNGTSAAVDMIFQTVQVAGNTTVTAASGPGAGRSASAPGFKVGTPPVYHDVATTATFAGAVTLCFAWTEGQFRNERNIKLFHYESGTWRNVTTSVDLTANRACGQVSSLSPFALFEVSYTFNGFYQPIDNLPVRNTVKAGSAIPVKFSLGGNRGLTIFDDGFPASQTMGCSSGTTDAVEETVTAGGSSLTYDPTLNQYKYVWKTDKSWANSCRRLVLQLNDGGRYEADFGFSK